VVILAAGKGTRMKEWTIDKTKAMLPLGKPMLEITIDNCRKSGLNKFIIVVGYRKDDIINYFGHDSGISYVEQENPSGGTADAVECAAKLVKTPTFLLIYADVIVTEVEIENLISLGTYYGPPSCMGVRRVSNPERYGVVEVRLGQDEFYYLKKITEKSPKPASNLVTFSFFFVFISHPFFALRLTRVSMYFRLKFSNTFEKQNLVKGGNAN